MNGHNNRLPGIGTIKTATPRTVLLTDQGKVTLPRGRVIVGADSIDIGNTGDTRVIRAGMLMGLNSTSKKYAPAFLGATGVLHDTSAVTTVMTLPAALITEITRRIGTSGTFIIVGPPAADGSVAIETVTFSAIAGATTLTITATDNDYASGSIIADNDGTYLAKAVIGDGYGIKVIDVDAVAIDVPFTQMTIGGLVDTDILLTATQALWANIDDSVKTWVRQRLQDVGPFMFSDIFE